MNCVQKIDNKKSGLCTSTVSLAIPEDHTQVNILRTNLNIYSYARFMHFNSIEIVLWLKARHTVAVVPVPQINGKSGSCWGCKDHEESLENGIQVFIIYFKIIFIAVQQNQHCLVLLQHWLFDQICSTYQNGVVEQNRDRRKHHWNNPLRVRWLLDQKQINRLLHTNLIGLNRSQFYKLYWIINWIRVGYTSKKHSNVSLLAITLLYLRQGSTYRMIAWIFKLGKSTISEILDHICGKLAYIFARPSRPVVPNNCVCYSTVRLLTSLGL